MAIRFCSRFHGSHFDLHFRAHLHQARDSYAAHGGEIFTHHLAISAAQFTQARVVFVAIRDVPRHARHVLGRCAGCLQDRAHIHQRLLGLRNEIVGFDLLLRVPANLAAGEDEQAARIQRDGDAVGIAFGRRPIGGLEDLEHGVLSKFEKEKYKYRVAKGAKVTRKARKKI